MAKIYYDADADLSRLKGRTVAVIGYGSQGHAHAQNLRDSGVAVVVGLHDTSSSAARAKADGFTVLSVDEAARRADLVMILTPDTGQKKLYEQAIAPHMKKGKTLLFAHGFNIRFGQIVPPPDVDVAMVAPKAPGHRVRELYKDGEGTPALVAVDQNASGHAREDALAYARALGCTRAGVLETTFAEETETDLFGEQAVLCGGTSELVRAGFETLVEAGYAPEIAYYECLHELKLIVDLMWENGLAGMRYSISDTAEFGDYTRGKRVIDEHVRDEMKGILADIQSGAFAREWVEDMDNNESRLKAMRAEAAQSQLETVGKELRGLMHRAGDR